jgi:glycosyltransferase involved in cell wall biosynthesis
VKIAWLASVIGCFGSVREMVEISNSLVRRGNTVTIYSEAGGPVTWLPCLTEYGSFTDAGQAKDLDVIILMAEWRLNYLDLLKGVKAKIRAVCVMGFEPSVELAEILSGETVTIFNDLITLRDALHLPGVMVLPDSQWQCTWIKDALGITCGPPMGGVNLTMFHPPDKRSKHLPRIIGTGDPRERKGSPIVKKAVDIIKQRIPGVEFETYWGKRLTQPQLVEFYQNGDVFLHAERRAGWCNPVAEAMACGTAVVCTNIPGVNSFAWNEKTALLAQVDDVEGLAAQAVRLLKDPILRERLSRAALANIRTFDYDLVAERLETALKRRL